ncbi:MAG: flagellar biosynthetic protein FliO [Bacteroidota bacterium]
MLNAELIQSLGIVVGFLVFVFFLSNLLKRMATNRKIATLGIDFKIVSKLPLTNKNILYIVQIGSNFLLLGASENNISAIADLTKVIQSSDLRTTGSTMFNLQKNYQQSSNPNSDVSFKNFLKETFKKSKN